MTNVNLEELKRLLAEATPGPWKAEPRRLVVGDQLGPLMSYLAGDRATTEGMTVSLGSERLVDHALVAALRNAAPALIEELKAAREDAVRYRWLRMHYRFANDSTQEIWFDRSIHPDALRGAGEPAELDKAIDDARKESA